MANSIKEVNRNYATGQKDFAGLSADVSQLPKKADGTVTGSIFYAIDTQQVYMFEATTDQWILSSEGGTGGSGGNAGGSAGGGAIVLELSRESENGETSASKTPEEIYEAMTNGASFVFHLEAESPIEGATVELMATPEITVIKNEMNGAIAYQAMLLANIPSGEKLALVGLQVGDNVEWVDHTGEI